MKNIALICTLSAATALGGCGVFPSYRIMQARGDGEAQLAQATANRQIRIQEAHAKLESAKLTAEAEIIKAHGVATANEIMSKQLGGPDNYLRWKYIEMLEENRTAKTIYIPTEAGLPILEAGHR